MNIDNTTEANMPSFAGRNKLPYLPTGTAFDQFVKAKGAIVRD
jgi:hypothetical protein